MAHDGGGSHTIQGADGCEYIVTLLPSPRISMRAPLTPRRVLNSLRRSRPWVVKVESSCVGYRTSFEQFPTLDAAEEALQRWSERLAEPGGA